MDISIDLVSGDLSCIKLELKFSLNLNSPGKGLLDSATLNNYSSLIHQGLSNNITSNISILHYTSANGIPCPLCPSTSSDDILVNDHFLNSVSRELTYGFPVSTSKN